jgi:NAD(P)-dependent dehydrogenase (short-subunit alcohol dehydrogenase family)
LARARGVAYRFETFNQEAEAMQSFRDKVVVVTGGASGIGKALVKAYAAEGAKVVISDVEASALEAAEKEVAATGADVMAALTDVRDDAALESLASDVFSRFGACHVLHNNAGVGVPNLNVWETEASDWEWVFGVNVRGVTNGIRAFVPRMIASGAEGYVVNTSSGDGGIAPLADQCIYASSKAAVSILTECLHAQLVAEQTQLKAAILYPSGGVLNTGIWTTARNRPTDLARKAPAPEGSEVGFEDFMNMMKQVGVDMPVQDLDELAQDALEGVKKEDFVIMIGREGMEEQLVGRAKMLAQGACPTDKSFGH